MSYRRGWFVFCFVFFFIEVTRITYNNNTAYNTNIIYKYVTLFTR